MTVSIEGKKILQMPEKYSTWWQPRNPLCLKKRKVLFNANEKVQLQRTRFSATFQYKTSLSKFCVLSRSYPLQALSILNVGFTQCWLILFWAFHEKNTKINSAGGGPTQKKKGLCAESSMKKTENDLKLPIPE